MQMYTGKSVKSEDDFLFINTTGMVPVDAIVLPIESCMRPATPTTRRAASFDIISVLKK